MYLALSIPSTSLRRLVGHRRLARWRLCVRPCAKLWHRRHPNDEAGRYPAGGKGTRLRERLGDLPKPLIDVCGVPLLERQILLAKRYGFQKVLILVNYRAGTHYRLLRKQRQLGAQHPVRRRWRTLAELRAPFCKFSNY
ncbi:nucleotidyltransferase family protein [Cupriavidus basilensis]